MNNLLMGTEENYVIVKIEGGNAKYTYIYESSVQEATSLENATAFETKEQAKEVAMVFNQIAQINQLSISYEVRKVTKKLEGVK